MSRTMIMCRNTALAFAIFAAFAFAIPGQLFAHTGGAGGSLDFSVGDICQMVGGAVALGFGLWHFAVPSIYGWQSYVPDAPKSLVDAVAATNFFFSLSLSLFGATNVVAPFIADSSNPERRSWLWVNVGLWTTRALYQIIKPQGTHNAALQWGMTGAFVVTDLLFLVAALEATIVVR